MEDIKLLNNLVRIHDFARLQWEIPIACGKIEIADSQMFYKRKQIHICIEPAMLHHMAMYNSRKYMPW